jgi:hypothetical protein
MLSTSARIDDGCTRCTTLVRLLQPGAANLWLQAVHAGALRVLQTPHARCRSRHPPPKWSAGGCAEHHTQTHVLCGQPCAVCDALRARDATCGLAGCAEYSSCGGGGGGARPAGRCAAAAGARRTAARIRSGRRGTRGTRWSACPRRGRDAAAERDAQQPAAVVASCAVHRACVNSAKTSTAPAAPRRARLRRRREGNAAAQACRVSAVLGATPRQRQRQRGRAATRPRPALTRAAPARRRAAARRLTAAAARRRPRLPRRQAPPAPAAQR